jgi:hypothetical protein
MITYMHFSNVGPLIFVAEKNIRNKSCKKNSGTYFMLDTVSLQVLQIFEIIKQKCWG